MLREQGFFKDHSKSRARNIKYTNKSSTLLSELSLDYYYLLIITSDNSSQIALRSRARKLEVLRYHSKKTLPSTHKLESPVPLSVVFLVFTIPKLFAPKNFRRPDGRRFSIEIAIQLSGQAPQAKILKTIVFSIEFPLLSRHF